MESTFNTYAIDNEYCPECDAKELVYNRACNAVHCQNCGTWFSLSKEVLEND